MANPIERLNNAIVALDFHARGPAVSNPDVERAVGLLVSHWLEFFVNEYQANPIIGIDQWTQRVEGYLRWYARAYALVPAAVRAKVPEPSAIDTTYQAMVRAEMDRIADAFQGVARESRDAVDAALGDQARKLAREMAEEVERVVSTTVDKARVATLAIGGFVAGLAVLYVSIKALR